MDDQSGDGNGNRRNKVDLRLTLGSPYPSANVLPTQKYTNHGTMMAGRGSTSGNANANTNPSYTSFMNQYHPLYNTLNSNNIGGSSAVGVPIMTPNGYVNLNFGEPIIGNSARRNNIDPNMRCSNANCNTNVTPLWRKGPLGPKTLCNACGIKYRKEEERKQAREARTSTGGT